MAYDLITTVLGAANAAWTVYGSLLTGVFSMLAVLAAFTGALVWADRFRRIFEQSTEALNSAHYSELDRFYAEILRLGIEIPHLRAPTPIVHDSEALARTYHPYPLTGSPEDIGKRLQYDAYACMVWNFLETIHDRCADNPQIKGTWAPVIGAENAIHRGWFLSQIRQEHLREQDAAAGRMPYVAADQFCVEFQAFVLGCQWQQVGGRYPSWKYRCAFTEARELRRTLDFGPPVAVGLRGDERVDVAAASVASLTLGPR